MEGQYECDPMVMDQMEKKMTLERFQREVSKLNNQNASVCFYLAAAYRILDLISVELISQAIIKEEDQNFRAIIKYYAQKLMDYRVLCLH